MIAAGCGSRRQPPVAAPTGISATTAPVQPAAASATSGAPPAPAPPGGTDLDAAKREFESLRGQVESAVAANPTSYELRMQAAQFYMRAGDHPDAIPHLQAAVQLSKRQLLSWVALGDAATLSDRFDLASKAYAQAETLSPGNAMIYLGRGQLLVRQQRRAEARKVLEAGRRRYPKDPEILFALGNLYLSLGAPKLAAKALQQTLAVEPNRPDVYYLLALAHEKDLQLETAVEDLRAAVRLEPRLGNAWGRMGLYLYKLTQYAEARNAMQNAIALDPREAYYHWVLGESYLTDTTAPAYVDRAVEAFRAALRLDAKNPQALQSLSVALTRRGTPDDLAEAVRLLERLLARSPNATQTHYLLYRTYLRLGKKQEAARHQARFHALATAAARSNQQRYRAASFVDTAPAHVGLGQRYLREKRYELAEKEFRLALERDATLEAARRGLDEVARGQRSASTRPTPGAD